MLPTQRVRLKDGGTEMIINVSDFDPNQHESLDGAPAPAAPDPSAQVPGPALTAAEIVAAIKTMDADALTALQVAETTREGGPRKTVIAAMTARFDQLNAPPAE